MPDVLIVMFGLSETGAARCGGASLVTSTTGTCSDVAVATCGCASCVISIAGVTDSGAAGPLLFTDFGVAASPFPALGGPDALFRGRLSLRGRLGVVAALSTLGEAGVTLTAGVLPWGRLPFRRPGRADAGDTFEAVDEVAAFFVLVTA